MGKNVKNWDTSVNVDLQYTTFLDCTIAVQNRSCYLPNFAN